MNTTHWLAMTFAALCAAMAPSAALAQAHSEAVAEEAPSEDETTWALSAGGLLNTGNTESWQATAGTNLHLVRGSHAFTLESAFNYGRANVAGDARGYVDTSRNLNARARYDYFFTENDAAFVALGYRWDTFAGLDARVQAQVGYLRNLVKNDAHRFWGELGYDLTFDNLDPDPLPDPATPGAFLPGTATTHSARLFLGYTATLNEHVQVALGLESLLNVQDPQDLRLNGDAALRASIAGNLQLETKFTMHFDNQPVPGKETLDTTTQLSLIYSLL